MKRDEDVVSAGRVAEYQNPVAMATATTASIRSTANQLWRSTLLLVVGNIGRGKTYQIAFPGTRMNRQSFGKFFATRLADWSRIDREPWRSWSEESPVAARQQPRNNDDDDKYAFDRMSPDDIAGSARKC